MNHVMREGAVMAGAFREFWVSDFAFCIAKKPDMIRLFGAYGLRGEGARVRGYDLNLFKQVGFLRKELRLPM